MRDLRNDFARVAKIAARTGDNNAEVLSGRVWRLRDLEDRESSMKSWRLRYAFSASSHRSIIPHFAWCGTAGADDGLRLIRAFLRIRDPELRVAAIDFVSDLAKRSEQAEWT
ncbi:MAG TPA: hypothetical protein VJY34_17795 [Roseiarcus sp.]|nr:hypothetical protein [Roseiarcus sp.]